MRTFARRGVTSSPITLSCVPGSMPCHMLREAFVRPHDGGKETVSAKEGTAVTVLKYANTGRVVTLTIELPDIRNSLGEESDGEVFAAACAQLNADREVRCAILTGAGPAFS